MIEQYASIASKGDMVLLQRLAERLSGKSFLHINSTFSLILQRKYIMPSRVILRR